MFCMLHYDYDNPTFAKGLGRNLEPKKFASELKKAHVEALSFFAKDVFGYSYYNTRLDKKTGQRHPGLNFDMLRDVMTECHRAGIRVIYYIVCFDQRVGIIHPDWIYQPDAKISKKSVKELARDTCGEVSVLKDITSGKRAPDPWVRMCLNSPYIEEIVVPAVKELCERYEPDGFHFDMFAQTTHTTPCYCKYCEKKFLADFGKPIPRNIKDPLWFDYIQWYVKSNRSFEKRVAGIIRSYDKSIIILNNASSSFHHPRAASENTDFLEVDCGDNQISLGTWSKYMVSHGKPMALICGRFLQMWSDWMLKPLDGIKQDAAVLLANGSRIFFGDKLSPDGRLFPTVVESEKKVFEFAKQRQPFVEGAKPVPYVGVLYSTTTFDRKSAISNSAGNYAGVNNMEPVWGASRALIQSNVPFVIFDEANLEKKLTGLKTLVVTGQTYLSETVLNQIEDFAKKGGGLVVTYDSGMFDEKGHLHKKSVLECILRIKRKSPEKMDNPLHYIQATGKGLANAVKEDPLMVHENSLKMDVLPGGNRIADLIGLVWHNVKAVQGPAGDKIGTAIVSSAYGRGRAIYCASEFTGAYLRRGNPALRLLMKYLVESVTKDKLIEVKAPPCVQVTFFEKEDKKIIHFVNYHVESLPEGRGVQPIQYSESTPPVYGIGVKLKLQGRVKKVTLQPEGQKLKFVKKGNYIIFEIPRIHIHSMAVVE